MVNTRQRALAAFSGLLSSGFNDAYAEAATTAGITPVAIAWDSEEQFAIAPIDSTNDSLSPLDPSPLAISLFTGNGGGSTGLVFGTGKVSEQFSVTLFFRYVDRSGVEPIAEIEAILNAINSGVLGVITPASLAGYNVLFDGTNWQCERRVYGQLPDGFTFDVTYTFTVEVSV